MAKNFGGLGSPAEIGVVLNQVTTGLPLIFAEDIRGAGVPVYTPTELFGNAGNPGTNTTPGLDARIIDAGMIVYINASPIDANHADITESAHYYYDPSLANSGAGVTRDTDGELPNWKDGWKTLSSLTPNLIGNESVVVEADPNDADGRRVRLVLDGTTLEQSASGLKVNQILGSYNTDGTDAADNNIHGKSIGSAELSDHAGKQAVATANIQDQAVTQGKIENADSNDATKGVSTGKIVDQAVTQAKIEDADTNDATKGVSTTKIVNQAVTDNKIQSYATGNANSGIDANAKLRAGSLTQSGKFGAIDGQLAYAAGVTTFASQQIPTAAWVNSAISTNAAGFETLTLPSGNSVPNFSPTASATSGTGTAGPGSIGFFAGSAADGSVDPSLWYVHETVVSGGTNTYAWMIIGEIDVHETRPAAGHYDQQLFIQTPSSSDPAGVGARFFYWDLANTEWVEIGGAGSSQLGTYASTSTVSATGRGDLAERDIPIFDTDTSMFQPVNGYTTVKGSTLTGGSFEA